MGHSYLPTLGNAWEAGVHTESPEFCGRYNQGFSQEVDPSPSSEEQFNQFWSHLTLLSKFYLNPSSPRQLWVIPADGPPERPGEGFEIFSLHFYEH